MRDYAKVSPQFWIGTTGKKLRAAGMEAQVVAMYLMTSPHANMIGLYYLPVMYLAHETGLGLQGARKGLQRAIEAQFCHYDPPSEMVWVPEMASYQIGDALSATDKRCVGVQREYDSLPENPFLQGFFERYQAAFHMTKMRSQASPSEAPSEGGSKPLRSQEQEQEQEQEHTHVEKSDPVLVVFRHWQTVHDHPGAKLDDKRRALIRRALRAYSVDVLCDAISGYRNSPHHMGQNPRGTKYDDIGLFLRDAEHIDAGVKFHRDPPSAKSAKPFELRSDPYARAI